MNGGGIDTIVLEQSIMCLEKPLYEVEKKGC